MKRKSLIVLVLVLVFSLTGFIFAEEISDFLTIKMKVGSKVAYINDELKVLDSPPIIGSSLQFRT